VSRRRHTQPVQLLPRIIYIELAIARNMKHNSRLVQGRPPFMPMDIKAEGERVVQGDRISKENDVHYLASLTRTSLSP
jgi:hypothetical protein